MMVALQVSRLKKRELGMSRKKDLLNELDEQFNKIQKKILTAKDNYLSAHQKDFEIAHEAWQRQKENLEAATSKVTKEVGELRESGAKEAIIQVKKARAVAVLLRDSLSEASAIMKTQKEELTSAKPFDKKLVARAKALAAFEKEWEKKQKAAEKARLARNKKRRLKRRQEKEKKSSTVPE